MSKFRISKEYKANRVSEYCAPSTCIGVISATVTDTSKKEVRFVGYIRFSDGSIGPHMWDLEGKSINWTTKYDLIPEETEAFIVWTMGHNSSTWYAHGVYNNLSVAEEAEEHYKRYHPQTKFEIQRVVKDISNAL